jgi:hypothetical protein
MNKRYSSITPITELLHLFIVKKYMNMKIDYIITKPLFNIGILLTSHIEPSVLLVVDIEYSINKYGIQTHLTNIDTILADKLNPTLFLHFKTWNKYLYKRFKSAVRIYKILIVRFNTCSSEKRYNFYKQICQLERKWYKANLIYNSFESIPNKVDGAMNRIEFIEKCNNEYKLLSWSHD